MIIFCYKALNIKLGESMLIRLFAFLFFSLTLTNCISVSSLQTARTLKEKEWSVQTAIGTQSVKFKEYSDNNDKKELQKTIESLSLPIVEFGFRYGLLTNLDAGIKFSLPGSLSIDAKYMILGKGSPFALAIGAGYNTGSYETEGSNKTKTDTSDIKIPLYLTYDIDNSISTYLVTQYIKRNTTSTGTVTAEEETTYYGVTGGITWNWLMLEYGLFFPEKDSSAGMQQITVGFTTGWDDVER